MVEIETGPVAQDDPPVADLLDGTHPRGDPLAQHRRQRGRGGPGPGDPLVQPYPLHEVRTGLTTVIRAVLTFLASRFAAIVPAYPAPTTTILMCASCRASSSHTGCGTPRGCDGRAG